MRTFLVPGLFLLFKSLFDKLIFEYNALLMFLSVCSIGLRHTLNSQRIDPIFCWMQVILGLAILNCSLAPLRKNEARNIIASKQTNLQSKLRNKIRHETFIANKEQTDLPAGREQPTVETPCRRVPAAHCCRGAREFHLR